MAEETTASVIPLHQVPPKKKAKRGAGRAKADPRLKRQKAKAVTPADAGSPYSEPLIPPEFLSVDSATTEPPVTRRHATEATLRLAEPVKPSRRQVAPVLVIDRGPRPCRSRHHHKWLVCPDPGIKRPGGMAVSRRWRGCRPGRVGDAVMRRRALGGWTAGYRPGRLGRVAHDLHLCGDGGYRVRISEHRRRNAGARGTRDAGRPNRPSRAW